jgi:hypothetical protein
MDESKLEEVKQLSEARVECGEPELPKIKKRCIWINERGRRIHEECSRVCLGGSIFCAAHTLLAKGRGLEYEDDEDQSPSPIDAEFLDFEKPKIKEDSDSEEQKLPPSPVFPRSIPRVRQNDELKLHKLHELHILLELIKLAQILFAK